VRDDLAEKTGQEEWRHLSPKSFRHSWAKNLLKDGVPPQTVMRWGGWRDPVSFHNLYISDDERSDYTQVYDTSVFKSKSPHYLNDEDAP
jgi:integrase